MTSVPASLKSVVVSYIKRAEEMEKRPDRDSRILAYYCRMFAVTRASKACTGASDEKPFLIQQLDLLESVKPTLSISGDEGQRICRNQADTFFKKADEADREGLADKLTVKVFYSAGNFYEILEQFGPLDNDTKDRILHCKKRATELLNALNAGEIPPPGGYGGSMPTPSVAPPAASSTPMAQISVPAPTYSSPPSVFVPPPAPAQPAYIPPQQAFVPPPSAPNYQTPPPQSHAHHAPQVAPPQTGPKPPPVNSLDPRVKDSMELCSFAMAALKHNEIALARDRLTEALKRLG